MACNELNVLPIQMVYKELNALPTRINGIYLTECIASTYMTCNELNVLPIHKVYKELNVLPTRTYMVFI